jgi:hypothetical protein
MHFKPRTIQTAARGADLFMGFIGYIWLPLFLILGLLIQYIPDMPPVLVIILFAWISIGCLSIALFALCQATLHMAGSNYLALLFFAPLGMLMFIATVMIWGRLIMEIIEPVA